MHIHEMLQKYGDLFYLVVFAWTFVEGETVVLLSGIVAREGAINIWILTIVAWIGSFLGDQMWFYLFRRFGKRLLDRFPRAKPKIGLAMRMIEKNAPLFILSYRFIYGVRNVAAFAIGASEISWARFASINFVSAGIWAFVFSWGGYFAGTAIKKIMAELSYTAALIAGIVFLIALIIGIYRHNHHQHSEQINEPEIK